MNIFKREDPNLKRNARIQKDREQVWRRPDKDTIIVPTPLFPPTRNKKPGV